MSRKTHSGRGGMGSKKHGVSGTPGYSPKARHAMRLEAEKKERKPKKGNRKYKSVEDAIRSNKP